MGMTDMVLVVAERDAEPVDGLCTTCWTSALWLVYFDMLSDSGVTPNAAVWTGCVECSAVGLLIQ